MEEIERAIDWRMALRRPPLQRVDWAWLWPVAGAVTGVSACLLGCTFF